MFKTMNDSDEVTHDEQNRDEITTMKERYILSKKLIQF